MLDGGAQRVFDRSAVEAGDRLKLVQRDDDLAAPRFGQHRWLSKHLFSQACDVTVGPSGRKRRGTVAIPSLVAGERDGASVALEECDVRAEAADGDGDGDRPTALQRRERAPDQRRLAVPSRRNQEDLLGRPQVGDESLLLVDTIRERARGHHLAVDERIAGYVT